MHDINFFSPYRVAKARTKDRVLIGAGVLVVIAIVAAAFFLLVNAQLNAVQKQIDEINVYLNSPDTKQKLTDVQNAKNEVTLLEQYLSAVSGARQDVAAKPNLDTSLLKLVEDRIPGTATLNSLLVENGILTLVCRSPVHTDAMDFLATLEKTGTFSKIEIASITMDPLGFDNFTLTCTLKGGA